MAVFGQLKSTWSNRPKEAINVSISSSRPTLYLTYITSIHVFARKPSQVCNWSLNHFPHHVPSPYICNKSHIPHPMYKCMDTGLQTLPALPNLTPNCTTWIWAGARALSNSVKLAPNISCLAWFCQYICSIQVSVSDCEKSSLWPWFWIGGPLYISCVIFGMFKLSFPSGQSMWFQLCLLHFSDGKILYL